MIDIPRLDAGIPGLEVMTAGGLPAQRMTLVAGTAGSGKTVFASQFLAGGIAHGDPAVFVTFEERPEGIRRNVRSLGMDIEGWEREGSWAFVNAAPIAGDETIVVGRYDLSSLVQRVKHAVQSVSARRVAIDSVGALLSQFEEVGPARHALFEIASELAAMDVTTVVTAERLEDYGPISRHGFEEFVADGVLLLRNALEAEKRRRTIEVLKLRGGAHMRGEHLFTLVPGKGMVVVPQESFDFDYASSRTRLTSGNDRLDQMLGGGFYDKSLVLVAGPTGAGKSLAAVQYIAGGVRTGERALLLSFEESRDQVVRNAAAWGVDFAEMEGAGRLYLLCEAPEAATLEDHLLRMKEVIDDFRPDRVAIDSLTGLQRIATARSFREYLLGLTFHIKSSSLLGLVTSATSQMSPSGFSLSDLHVSTISDTILVLQYVPIGAEMHRGMNVLKMRGSQHDKALREFVIDDAGMHVGEPFADLPPGVFRPPG